MRSFIPIRDYLFIGDLYSAALVSNTGSIDWLCWPNFDSPSLFGKLLDNERGGRFALDHPQANIQTQYLGDTAVLEHIVDDPTTGSFLVHDCMLPQPIQQCPSHLLCRNVQTLHQEALVRFVFDPRPNFGQEHPVMQQEQDRLRFMDGQTMVDLILPPMAEVRQQPSGSWGITLPLSAHQRCALVLEYRDHSPFSCYTGQDIESETTEFWQQWVARGRYPTSRRAQLVRSAITLKLMQYYPTGALVAAPTTSLPECIGGGRNWDYRYVWIRDATSTIYAFLTLGHTEEAKHFLQYMERVLRKERDWNLDVIYTIEGNRAPTEKILDHLSGYQDSVPVREGNAATEQFQLDVYGALIDAIYYSIRNGIELTDNTRSMLLRLAEHIRTKWQQPDHGFWEARIGPQQYTYSKVMCWVGIDRILRLNTELQLDANQQEQFHQLLETIRQWIYTHCFDARRNIFYQFAGALHHDATTILFVLLQFLDRSDPLTRSTIEATRNELTSNNILLYRYHADDGIEGNEGVFLLPTFWLISALCVLGDTDQAEALLRWFEGILPASGLMAEEMEPTTQEYLGNFPQAFSHIGYIMAASYIQRYRNRASSPDR
ncbi:glycoside hydrolase family 15 protein [Candidatus Uhrbacteria bacterium]|nr:glycoside hydrolase family 15 protein [Candidatus Uhrbacteria bacterium]